jgi:hypothetical protein
VSLKLELTTQSNWTQIYSESRNAVYVSELAYTPIPAFEVGINLDTPVVVIRATSRTARGWWKSAGRLYQRFQTGTIGAVNPLPVADSADVFVPLNRSKLIQFKLWQPEYSLVYLCPDYFDHVAVAIWAYTGPVVETTLARFDSVDADLDQIIMKIGANTALTDLDATFDLDSSYDLSDG